MYNYHTDLVFKIDIALLGVFILLGVMTVLYALMKEASSRRRSREISNIKNNVYELILSGQKIDNKLCLPAFSGITPRQFLDAAVNRSREAVFFNESEQKVIKQCFLSAERAARIEKTAGRSWNKWRRIEAILSLGYAQSVSSLGVLKKSINDSDADLSYFSIIALGQIHSIASARILLDFLKSSRFHRHKVIAVLETFPKEIGREAVLLTHAKDPEVSSWAIKLISKLKPEGCLKEITGLLQDNSEEVRAAACACLGELGDREAKGALIKCLNDDLWLVRAHAVKALSKLLGKECLPEVIRLINDPSLSVIDSLKGVLAEHIVSAIPYLEKFLSGSDEISRRVAREVLEVAGYIVKMLKDILSSGDEEKIRAVRLLEGMAKSGAHFGLEAALMSFSGEEQERILTVIRNMDKQMAEHIAKHMAGEMHKPL